MYNITRVYTRLYIIVYTDWSGSRARRIGDNARGEPYGRPGVVASNHNKVIIIVITVSRCAAIDVGGFDE